MEKNIFWIETIYGLHWLQKLKSRKSWNKEKLLLKLVVQRSVTALRAESKQCSCQYPLINYLKNIVKETHYYWWGVVSRVYIFFDVIKDHFHALVKIVPTNLFSWWFFLRHFNLRSFFGITIIAEKLDEFCWNFQNRNTNQNWIQYWILNCLQSR